MGTDGEDDNDMDAKGMDLEGLDLYGIVDACHI